MGVVAGRTVDVGVDVGATTGVGSTRASGFDSCGSNGILSDRTAGVGSCNGNGVPGDEAEGTNVAVSGGVVRPEAEIAGEEPVSDRGVSVHPGRTMAVVAAMQNSAVAMAPVPVQRLRKRDTFET